MTEHTSLNWTTRDNVKADGMHHFVIENDKGIIVCSLTPQHRKTAQDEANAEFICRACNNFEPLLAAARDALMQFDHNGDESDSDKSVLNELAAAIAEATKGKAIP